MSVHSPLFVLLMAGGDIRPRRFPGSRLRNQLARFTRGLLKKKNELESKTPNWVFVSNSISDRKNQLYTKYIYVLYTLLPYNLKRMCLSIKDPTLLSLLKAHW